MATNRFEVSDALWAKVRTLLPVHVNRHRFGGGRPRVPDRVCLHAVLFVLRTGCQWKALDATGICSGSTAHRHFQQWVQAGVFEHLFHDGVKAYHELCGIDWSFLSLDGSLTKAPLGGGKNRGQPHRSGQTRGQTQPAGRRPGRAAGRGGRRGQRAGHVPGR